MTESTNIVCLRCLALNRIPAERLGEHPKCGKCKEKLFDGKPHDLSKNGFERNLKDSGIPLVVDFWASWCGPCKVMMPAFAQAAAELEPVARLVRINTELEQAVANRFVIRAIPTMIMFNNGIEVQRESGAMTAKHIIAWVRAAI